MIPINRRNKENLAAGGAITTFMMYPLKIKVGKSSRLTLYFENKDTRDSCLN